MSEPADEGSPQLRQLSAEVDRIARALAKLSAPKTSEPPPNVVERRQQPDRRAQPDRRDTARAEMLGTLRSIMRARRMREQFFSADLFADPAWDMLLDLLHARLEQRPVAVSSLCIAAAVPPTTALRWIKRLTDEGIFVRTADPNDGRRIFIDLSDAAADGMAAYMQQVGRMGFGFLPHE
jgi:DNA-binding MarR family transcriptional regulator